MPYSKFHAAPLALLALLAACGTSEAPAPMGNDSMMSDTAPAANAAAPTETGMNAAAPAPGAIREVGYTCKPEMAVTARYDNTDANDPEVKLTIDGKTYDLDIAPSASGARYTTDDGRAENMTLVWWTKGAEATLFEGKEGGKAEDEKPIATCTEKQTA